MRSHKATRVRPYQYLMSGLENVYLVGVEVFRCPKCGRETAAVPRVPELHRLIAWNLFMKAGTLSGSEIRFFRKHAGKTGREFAAMIGVRPEHLSRAENDKYALGETADRLVRVLGVLPGARESGAELLDRITEDISTKRPPRREVFTHQRGDWKKNAA
jgi:transcriptional regulator with XRE-family HTH domain